MIFEGIADSTSNRVRVVGPSGIEGGRSLKNGNIRDTPTAQKGALRNAKLVFVGYALFDLVLTLITMNRFVERALAEELEIDRQIHKMVDPFLLLVIAIGFWLSRKWSYSVSLAAGALLLYRGLIKWEAIASAQFPEVPMFSWPALTWWWRYGGAEWDFPRFLIVVLVIAYGTIFLSRNLKHGSLGARKSMDSK